VPDFASEGADNNTDGDNHGVGDANATESSDLLLSPPHPESEAGGSPNVSESEDVADRAASMLQGLRDNSDPERTRRRRESAEEERRKRRLRRRNGATSGSKDSTDTTPLSPVQEPALAPQDEFAESDNMTLPSSPTGQDPTSNPPTIVLSSNEMPDDDDKRPSSS
jgi:cytokinesis protein